MPNVLSATGLQTATTDETATDLAAAMQAIYGDDINTQPESPDGQMIGAYAQMDTDQLDLTVDVYNMFSVASAYGAGLQRLVEVNGMAIKGGTYSTTPVNVTANAAGTVPGLDQTAVPPYQATDGSGNLWTLLSSYAFGAAGTQALVFQAAAFGPITPLPNTISAQATPLSFVASVNNPSVAGAVIGQAEETDAALRTRQAQSFSLPAVGLADAVEAALLNLADVADAAVYENKGTALYAMPLNTLWCVVVGGTAAEIAAVIYAKCSCAGLYGAQNTPITRPNGQPATIAWDIGVAQPFWAQFSIIPATAGLTFNNTLLLQQLAAALIAPYWRLGRPANIGDIVRAMFVINPQVIVVNPGVSSTGVPGTFSPTNITPSSPTNYFTLPVVNLAII